MLTPFWTRWRRTFAMVCVASVLSLGMAQQPSIAQTSAQSPDSPAPIADVVVDGRVLFRLGSIEGFSAERRAESVNTALQTALLNTSLDSPIDVRVVQRDGLTILRVDSRHLLTVTQGDFRPGVTPKEQAENWAATLQTTLARAQQERRPGYTKTIIWQILLVLGAAIALHCLVRWLRRWLWRRKTQRNHPLSARNRLLQPALLGLQGSIWVAFLLYLCELLPWARTARYNAFWLLRRTFTNGLLTMGSRSYSLLDIFKLIFVAILLWVTVRGLTSLIKVRFLQATIPDRGIQNAITTVMQFSLTGLGLFILLQAWGIDLSTLTIFASVLGVGLGFGLQNIANNFISGWILLIERPVQVGDFINLGDLMGTVERIGARSTELRTLDRVSIIVPNTELVQTRVINWSHGHPVSRLHLPLGVAYGSDIKQVHTAIIEAAQTHPEVLRYPQPRLRFLGFGESSLDFDLLVWLRDPRRQFDLKSDLYYLLEANLRRYQIEIPFPQRDLNLKPAQLQSVASTLHDGNHMPSPSEVVPEPPAFMVSPSPDLLETMMDYSAILQSPKSIAADELEQLVEQMRGPEGLAIRDRKFRLTVYPNCFVGSEAVSWIVKTQKATREAAVRLGELLVERGIIHHVIDEHSFKDEYLFYRFYEDESSGSG